MYCIVLACFNFSLHERCVFVRFSGIWLVRVKLDDVSHATTSIHVAASIDRAILRLDGVFGGILKQPKQQFGDYLFFCSCSRFFMVLSIDMLFKDHLTLPSESTQNMYFVDPTGACLASSCRVSSVSVTCGGQPLACCFVPNNTNDNNVDESIDESGQTERRPVQSIGKLTISVIFFKKYNPIALLLLNCVLLLCRESRRVILDRYELRHVCDIANVRLSSLSLISHLSHFSVVLTKSTDEQEAVIVVVATSNSSFDSIVFGMQSKSFNCSILFSFLFDLCRIFRRFR